jgi:hypothetical protein
MITVIVTNATGINEENLQNAFSIYPNPTNGEFTITNSSSINNYELKITNVLGETVFEKAVSRKQETINLNEGQGIYFLQLRTETGAVVKKIIKE